MDVEISAGAVALLILALGAGGLVSGFLAGLFGIGGGAITVPILYEVWRVLDIDPEIRMHMAVGTSLAVMVPTLQSLAHRARGSVDIGFLKRLAAPVVLGVAGGALIASVSESTVLKWVWVVFASALAAKLFWGQDDWRLGKDIPKSRLVELYGVFVGVLCGLLSIGGGAFMTMLMMLYGRPIHQAVGTSAGFGPLVSIPGAIGFMIAGWGVSTLPLGSVGYVNLIGAAIISCQRFAAHSVRSLMASRAASWRWHSGCFMAVLALRYALDRCWLIDCSWRKPHALPADRSADARPCWSRCGR